MNRFEIRENSPQKKNRLSLNRKTFISYGKSGRELNSISSDSTLRNFAENDK